VLPPGRLLVRGGTDHWAVHGRTVLKRAVADVGLAIEPSPTPALWRSAPSLSYTAQAETDHSSLESTPSGQRSRPGGRMPRRGSLGIHDRTVLRCAAAGVGFLCSLGRRWRCGDPRVGGGRLDMASSPPPWPQRTPPPRRGWMTAFPSRRGRRSNQRPTGREQYFGSRSAERWTRTDAFGVPASSCRHTTPRCSARASWCRSVASAFARNSALSSGSSHT
jgi:hypothetical protein